MHKFIILAGIAAGLGNIAPEAKAYWRDGNDLLAECTSMDPADTSFCLGYVAGLMDGYETGGIRGFMIADGLDGGAAREVFGSETVICVPERATLGQVRDTIVDYLEDNPSVRHYLAGILVERALYAAFPC